MTQAKNAIEAYNAALQVHSSNIANMSVMGYKRLDISFQSIFEKTLQRGSPASTYEGLGGINPVQLGQGVAIANVGVDFSQGTFITASYLDLAISGQGLFIVTPDQGLTQYYTRAGHFHLDASGNMLTDKGMQVYGFRHDTGNLEPISLAGFSYNPALLSFTNDGILAEFPEKVDESGSRLGVPDVDKAPTQLFYQIALTSFPNPSGLQQFQGTCFAQTLASGESSTPTIPGGAVGVVYPRQLEQSNVFYLGETIDSMDIQRAMSGNLSIVRMVSDIISTFINRLG